MKLIYYIIEYEVLNTTEATSMAIKFLTTREEPLIETDGRLC